jgi:hypothetical protein
MNNGATTNQNNRKKIPVILLILLILGLISSVLLSSVLNGMLQRKKQNNIPIGDDISSDVVSSDGGEGEDNQMPLDEFKVVHSKRIFCVSYANGKGETTALSDDGEKIIAPGTSWNYSFSLQNTKNFTLRYAVRTEAIIEGLDEGMTLPVLSRLKGPNGWLTKQGNQYTPVLELNDILDNGVLSPNTEAKYRLGWQWPFESGNDELDTMLGDLALEKDITLYINIYVYAREETDQDIYGGEPIPGTGDDFRIGFWLAAMIISLFAFIAVLANSRRRDDCAE